MTAGISYNNNQVPTTSNKNRKPSRWLRKTKLCVYHLQNNCCLGSSCLFAHTLSELQDGPDLYKTQLCIDFMNGNCQDPDCTFAHGQEEVRAFPTLKQKRCKWHRKGQCRNGDSCSFAHGRQDLRQPGAEDSLSNYPVADPSDYPAADRQQQQQQQQQAAIPQPPTPVPVMFVSQPAPSPQQQQQQQQQVLYFVNLQAALPTPGASPTNSMTSNDSSPANTMVSPPPGTFNYTGSQETVYNWQRPEVTGQQSTPTKRTPLNSKVAPFVPTFAQNTVAPPTIEQLQKSLPQPLYETSTHYSRSSQNSDDDTRSTSAESWHTGGYVSD